MTLETQALGYPETEDISSEFPDTIGMASYADKPMRLSSPLKLFSQSVTGFLGVVVTCFQHENYFLEQAFNYRLSRKD